MNVLTTGMFNCSAKRIKCSVAPARITPLPARISGYFAAERISAAWRMVSAWASGRFECCTGTGALPSISISAMFSGKSMKLTPGFSAWACLNALRTTSGMVSGSRIWMLYFEIGRKRFTRSRCWWLSLCSRVVADCPAMATTGAWSMLASATPVTRLVAPGPSVARQTPARPGQPAVDVGHEGGGLFVAGGDEADRAVEQDIENVDVLFAGKPEDGLHALVFQTTHEQFGSLHRR